jgi:hypothetical protein
MNRYCACTKDGYKSIRGGSDGISQYIVNKNLFLNKHFQRIPTISECVPDKNPLEVP